MSAGNSCKDIALAVLGSGGPELSDGRSSSGFAAVHQSQAKILVDAGSGSSREFEALKLSFNDVKAILLTHLHVDHVNDLASYVKGAFFTGRTQNLSVIGPHGNQYLPATTDYVQRLLGKQQGLYPYLNRHLPENAGESDYQLNAKDASEKEIQSFTINDDLEVASLPTQHGAL